jgi:hypothetical protein
MSALTSASEDELHDTLLAARERIEFLESRNHKLEQALRWHIRVYRVDDQAWNPAAEVDRIFESEMRKPE